MVGRQLLNPDKDHTGFDAVWGSIWEDFLSPSSHSNGKEWASRKLCVCGKQMEQERMNPKPQRMVWIWFLGVQIGKQTK